MVNPKRLAAVLFILAALLAPTSSHLLRVAAAPGAPAATSPILIAAASYSVLAGSTVDNTGTTTVSGDLGVSPSIGVPPHVTGSPTVGPPGEIHDADAHAAAAQADNIVAFGALDQPCTVTYGGVQDLTLVSPLVPGVYCAVSFGLSGNLTLTGSGVWIFKSSETVITSPDSSVTGVDECNVWWRVGSSATLDTNTDFIGNILALTAITLNTGATLNGRAMAQTAAVTLDANDISGCLAAPPATATPTPTPTATATPTPTATPTDVPTGLGAYGLRAAPNAAHRVNVLWKTASEANILGFRVLRSEQKWVAGSAVFEQVGAGMVEATQSGSNNDQTYTITDATATAGRSYRYMLEVYGLDGTVEELGPVTYLARTSFYMPMMQR